MDSVNKTLYIPLRGKSYVSRRGLFLRDPDAERIWESVEFPLTGKSASKWLAFSMGIRAAVFDRWLEAQLADREAVVLHLGCGLDSRANRVDAGKNPWFDVDFPEVIRERRKFFRETETYRMLCADLRQPQWLDRIPKGGRGIVALEGVSMYLQPGELGQLLHRLGAHFSEVRILMDCYSEFAAQASKYKNPINDVGVTQVFGLEDPGALAAEAGLIFAAERDMNPAVLVEQLSGLERIIYRRLYAGSFAKKLYKLYEFRKKPLDSPLTS